MSVNSRTLIKNLRKQERSISLEDTEINNLIHEYKLANIYNEIDKFQSILKEYHIDYLYDRSTVYNHVINDKKDHNNYTYHNLKHVKQMLLNCYEGSIYEKLHRTEIKSLLVAAMFHDAEHSLGHQQDKFNIDKAIECFKNVNSINRENNHQYLNETEFELVIKCIRYTQYPYIDKGNIPRNENCKLFRIIRDADLMTIYNYDTSIDLYQGLYNELKNIDSISHFIELQTEFLSKVQWNTQWAKKKAFIRNYPQQIKNLNLLLTSYLKD